MRLTPEREASYALDFGVSRDDLPPEAQAEYDRQKEIRLRGKIPPPDAVFPALGVQVRGEVVESYGAGTGTKTLGPLIGAMAQLTEGSQAWSPGKAMLMPVALAGLATKTKATAFVIFPDGTYTEKVLDGNTAVREAQAEAVKFNLLASTRPAQPTDDTAATLRKLDSLHREGLLSDEELTAKRAEVIARI